MTLADHARARLAARAQVLACTRCPLHRSCTRPVPFHGPMAATVAVVGEAPGRQEDKVGRPFAGPAGQLLRRLLTDTGIDPESLVWLNTVSCFPGRTPRQSEIDACRPNLTAQLSALAPTHVLVAGGVALSGVRPDLKITAAHGRLLGRDGRWFFPVHHPSAALRNPALVDILAGDLHRWAKILAAPDPRTHFCLSCVVCGRLVDRFDPDGMAWCANHHGRGFKGWEKSQVPPTVPPTLPTRPVVEDVIVQAGRV